MVNSLKYIFLILIVLVNCSIIDDDQKSENRKQNLGIIAGLVVYQNLSNTPSTKAAYLTSLNDNSISTFSVQNADTLELKLVQTLNLSNVRDTVVSRNKKYLFASTSTGMNSYAVDSSNYSLSLIDFKNIGVDLGKVCTSKNGNYLYSISAISTGLISIFSTNASNGNLTHLKNVSAGSFPSEILCTEKYVFVVNRTTNFLTQFTINSESGDLTQSRTIATDTAPSALAITPDFKYLYVTNSTSNTVSIYGLNYDSGVITASGTVSAIGTYPTAVTISSDNKYLYVSNNTSNTISSFAINEANGTLTNIATVSGVTGAVNTELDGTGAYLLAGNQSSPGAVSLIKLDKIGGVTLQKSFYMERNALGRSISSYIKE